MKNFLLALLLFIPIISFSQEKKEEPKYGINFSGFIKNDFFFDSRDNYTLREGHFLLFPKEKNLDSDGNDINDKTSFNFLSIQSRLTGKITAPDAFGAKTTGILEADFFGNENTNFIDANGFRLRHAYVKLNWENTELLAGQYWHPLFVPGCFSGVISFNTGAPFQPFSRNPQIRLTHKLGKLSISGALSAQRDFTSALGSAPLRYSSIPNISTIFSFENKDVDKKTDLLAGIVLDYKTIQPLLTTTKGGKTFINNEKVTGRSVSAFLRYKNPSFTFKLQGIYGENLYDLTMLGGYAVKAITDTAKNTVSYTTINAITGWTEFQTNGEKIQFGLWAGYTQNIGANDSILNYKIGITDLSRGSNVKSIIRVSPRVVFIQGKFNFATEFEYTTASYATKEQDGTLNRDVFGVVTKTENVTNMRLLLSVIYNF
jgi:hypothetical protein